MRDQERCAAAEPLADFEDRTQQAVRQLCDHSHAEGGRTVAVVAHSAVISALICHCLELPEVEESLSLFRTDAGSVTVVNPSTQQALLHASAETRDRGVNSAPESGREPSSLAPCEGQQQCCCC